MLSHLTEDYYEHERPEMLSFVPTGTRRLLDVGCGTGAYAAACKRRFGLEAWGIEQNPTAAAQAAGRLDRVLQGSVKELLTRLPPRYFDLVTCNDVLEHLVEPEAVLNALHDVLTPDGTVVASIPNIRYGDALRTLVWDADFPRADEGIFDRTHLRFFTKKVIERMFADCGFQLERIEGINPRRRGSWRLINLLTGNRFSDCYYLQFACVARSLRNKQ